MYFPFGLLPEQKNVRRTLLFVVTTFISLPVLAQQSIPLTLAEAEDRALLAEPGQQALQAKAAALRERGVVAGELPDPMLRVGLNNFPIQSGGFTTEGMTHAAVGLRQVFPAGKTRSINTRRFDLMASDLATITRSLYAVGRKSQQDVLRAELELSRLDDRLIEMERQHARAVAVLGEWIGQDGLRLVARELPSWEQMPTLDSMQVMLQQHPMMRAADSQVDARSAGVDLANERAKPGWALDLGFRKKSVDSTLSAALQERSAARSSREQTLRGLQSQLNAEYARWQDLTRRLALYDTHILNQTKDHAEASLLGYQSDQGDFADVMRGYIDDLNTRIDHIRLQVERAQSYAVLANLGGIPR